MIETGLESDRSPEAVRDVVATFPNVLTPVKYGMLPVTAALDVERPLNPTVAPERVIGQEAEMVACLPLNVVQSVFERSPRRFVAEAVGMFSV